MKEVVAAIIKKGDLILIAKRGHKQPLPGLWEFPGGKVEKGETPEVGLKREMKEELNIDIKVEDFFCESVYRYPRVEINLLTYFSEIINGEIKLSVHDDIKWVKSSELKNFEFAPADIKVVNKLINM